MELIHNKYSRRYMWACCIAGLNGILASMVAMAGLDIAFMRALITAAALGVIFVFTHRGKITAFQDKKAFACLAMAGICLGLNWIVLYQAYDLIGVSLTIVLCYLGPVFSMALSPIVFHERMTAGKAIGICVVVAGAVCINGLAASQGVSPLGILLGILSGVFMAGANMFNKKTQPIDSTEVPLFQMLFSLATLAIFMGIAGDFTFNISAHDWVILLIIGVVISASCNWMSFTSIPKIPVQTASILGYFEPMCAVILSAAVLGETLAPVQIAGIALIIGGVFIAEFWDSGKKAIGALARR